MLPFEKHKKEASVSMPHDVIQRKADGGEAEHDEYDHVEACAEDLLHAIKAGNVKNIAAALRSAFIIMESEPHVEGPHEEEGELE